jgi:predicted Rossmann fold flavoprotein
MPSPRALTISPGVAIVDVAVVGAGAAGLMAAIQAGRAAKAGGRVPAIVALDGATTLGAKILIAGGGRCNVTHDEVSERAFAGSTPASIRKVLRRFGVGETIAFFEELGVGLKREETGKLFPETDRARTVLDALLRAAGDAGVRILHPWRVETIRRDDDGVFALCGPSGELRARRVILATGGRSLPRSGSDGHGYAIARSLGHTTTRSIVPALVPLALADRSFPRRLSGVSCDVRADVRSASGKRLGSASGPLLCTHIGLSGPAILDISRHLIHARLEDPGAHLTIAWLVEGESPPAGRPVARWLKDLLPDRLAEALVEEARVDGRETADRLPREARRRLASTLTAWRAPVTGDLGFSKAEVTAGGVPLSELKLDTMESRVCPGLYLCGEILDVDGRIGGYNFQWAWASGAVAGRASLRAPGGESRSPRDIRSRASGRTPRTP